MTANSLQRVIGRFEGTEKGPLLICFGGLHGNETAGVKALQMLLQLLDAETLHHPDFHYKGRFLALRGNVRAQEKNVRFLGKDLNRQLTQENVLRIFESPESLLDEEDLEIKELLHTVFSEIRQYKPDKVYILDLHTTSAGGGIFTIPSDDPESIRIALSLHAPVVKGLMRGIQGTTLHYFNTANFGQETVAVSFEAGQHEDPVSVQRCLSAIVSYMRAIGSVRPEDVETRHEDILLSYSKNLPSLTELITCHHIRPEDEFCMEPGFQNFQPVRKGQLLAYDRRGPILSPDDGYLLMPLYQKQGSDGFFLIQ